MAGGGEARSFQEDIYWTHFHFTHFTQFLRNNDFRQQLALPKTFSDNKKNQLPQNVGLKGPGKIVWNVKLMTVGDTMYFTEGWEQFVNDNSLKENDFIVFKYNGHSLFEVLIFDGESFCENVAPYFVREGGRYNVEQQINMEQQTYVEQQTNVAQHVNGAQHANGTQHVNGEQNVNVEQEADEEQHATVEQQGGGGNSRKRVREDSAENVDNTPSDAGVEVALPEQFAAADEGTNTEPPDVPSKPTNKRVKRSATKKTTPKPRGRPPKKASKSPAGEQNTWITESSSGKGIDAEDLLL